LPTNTGIGRGLRDSWLGRVAIFAVVLLAALLVARSCGATDPKISQNEAVGIAKGEIDYQPDCERIRFVKRGLSQQEIWLVGLAKEIDRTRSRVTNVLIDADSGEILQVQGPSEAVFRC
jgi:hypothetical protein